MSTIRQYIPAFIEGIEPAFAEFGSVAELFAIPFVARWAADSNFHRFSVSDQYLICELRGGREWRVVGRIDGPIFELPEWDRGIYECAAEDGSLREIPGSIVSYSCGDEVGLKDGQKLRRWKRP